MPRTVALPPLEDDPVTVIPDVGQNVVEIRGRNAAGDVVIAVRLDGSASEAEVEWFIRTARRYARSKGQPRLRAI